MTTAGTSPMLSKSLEDSVCIVNNIPTPYRRALFDELARQAAAEKKAFAVIYLAATETVRNWKVELRPFESILPVVFQKRNRRTPTSDTIINRSYLAQLLRPKILVLFGYNYPTYFVAAFLRSMLRRRTCLFCETTLADSNPKGGKKLLKSLLLRLLFDRFIVPGQRSLDYLVAHNVDRKSIFVARNASPIRPDRQPEPLSVEKLRLLFVGRLAPEKRILEFVQAFMSLDPPEVLTLVGDGPLFNSIQTLAAQHTRVELLGAVAPEQLSEIYASHDVLVLVSESETWGLVANEAINHGLALLLSPEVGCAPDLLDGNGTYLTEITAGRLAAALDKITTNREQFRARSLEIAAETTVEQQATDFLAALTEPPNAAS